MQAAREDMSKAGKARLPCVVAISSGKGGVGKTSIAVNLGISLAKLGTRVCLLDADTGLANVNILLGKIPEYTLEHVLFGAKPIEDVLLEGPHGLKVIPGANGISECVNLHPRQQLRLTRELARIEGEFDYLLVDTAAGIADTTLDFVSAAQHVVVVITTEPTSLTDAFSLIKLLKRRREAADYHIVVNMCGNVGEAREVFHRFSAAVEKYIGVQPRYLGFIPRDESLRAAVALQNPVACFPSSDPSSRNFLRLAEALQNATESTPVSGSFSAYWHRRFRAQRDAKLGPPSKTQAGAGRASGGTAARDNSYLSELRSRLLLMIDEGQAEVTLVRRLLRDAVAAFVRRHEESPVDVLELVGQLIGLPDRNDQLLRDLHARLSPWGAPVQQPPTLELVARAVARAVGPTPVAVTPVPVKEPDDFPESVPGHLPPGRPSATEVDAEVCLSAPVGVRRSHLFDQQRFGSQQGLLEQLRLGADAAEPLADWLQRIGAVRG